MGIPEEAGVAQRAVEGQEGACQGGELGFHYLCEGGPAMGLPPGSDRIRFCFPKLTLVAAGRGDRGLEDLGGGRCSLSSK